MLFGSTAFDSFKDSTPWVKFIQGDFVPSTVWRQLFINVGLLVFVLAVAVIFTLGTMLTGVGPDQPRRELPGQFAHSIVPIVIGYIIAHYLTYLIEVGEQTIVYMSDPFSNGSNWFGTANWQVDYFFSYHPTLLATVKVLAVVLGHVLGVIAAHDRAIQLLPQQAPADRPALAARRDDLLHRRRALPALRGLSAAACRRARSRPRTPRSPGPAGCLRSSRAGCGP